MASNTPRLGLYKKDPIADANDTFNIQTMLNDNWDKIDGKVAILGPDGKILSEQLPQQSLPSASTTQAGIVQLNDTLTSTSTTQAATANAVKRVNDAVVAHLADNMTHVPSGKYVAMTSRADQRVALQDLFNAPYKIEKLNKDSNGIYTTVRYKREDDTLAIESTLSGGTSPNYNTRTIKIYADDGTTVLQTITRTITYDSDGNIISEV